MKPLLLTLICGLIIVIGIVSCSAGNKQNEINNSVVKTFNLERYLGLWYEIARFDHSFERGMDGVKAEYSMRDDGLIKVINSGYKGGLNGKYKEIEGKARIPNKEEASKIEVAFFWNFWGDYFVMELADDYSYALIGSSTDKYLWILSRTPQLSAPDRDFLIKRIKERGYDDTKLIWVRHN